MKPENRLLLLLLAALPLVGALGFMLIEGWNFLDSLYMSVITLTTVGYEEVHPLSRSGRIFVMCYLAAGLGVFFFGLARFGEMIVRAELTDWLGRRRMSDRVKKMSDHYVVCGFGRMGRSLARQLAAKRQPFVVVDRSEASLAECREQGWAFVVGDATDDGSLREAGIERARGVATVLSSDADNLYVVLSARLMAPKVQIISRADDEKSVVKMQKAGADRVISLYGTSAIKMAQLLANPNLEDFIEIFTSRGSELDLAEIQVVAEGPYVGKTLEQTDFRRRGVIIVGIRRAGGELLLPPPSTLQLAERDELIAMGTAQSIAELLRGS